MKTLTERLNLSMKDNLDNSMKLKLKSSGNSAYYDNLCLYCAENNIDLKNISDADFEACADAIETFAGQYDEYNQKVFYFSIDAN